MTYLWICFITGFVTWVTRQVPLLSRSCLPLQRTSGFKWSWCCSMLSFVCNVLYTFVYLLFLLAIVLSVLLLRLPITPMVSTILSVTTDIVCMWCCSVFELTYVGTVTRCIIILWLSLKGNAFYIVVCY